MYPRPNVFILQEEPLPFSVSDQQKYMQAATAYSSLLLQVRNHYYYKDPRRHRQNLVTQLDRVREPASMSLH